MTPEKTAVKGSYWFIFHEKRDVMNSKLRGTRGKSSVSVWQGCCRTSWHFGHTACCLAYTMSWDRLSGLGTFEEGRLCPLQKNTTEMPEKLCAGNTGTAR